MFVIFSLISEVLSRGGFFSVVFFSELMEKKVFCRRPGSAALLYVTIMGKGYSNYYEEKEAEEKEADLKTSKSPPAASTFFFRKLITLFEFAMFIFYIELKYSFAVQLSFNNSFPSINGNPI